MNDSTANDTEDPSRNDQRARRFEVVVVTISAILVVALLGYAAWQTATASGAVSPQTHIKDTTTQSDGSVIVTVSLSNPQDHGLEQVTVTTVCEKKSIPVLFEHVPAMSTETAQVMCPPGTDRPMVSISSWIK
jgi:hypothetical protein